jgi:hypothetical protein
MSRKWIIRLLFLPFMLFLIHLYGWELGEKYALKSNFIYENF